MHYKMNLSTFGLSIWPSQGWDQGDPVCGLSLVTHIHLSPDSRQLLANILKLSRGNSVLTIIYIFASQQCRQCNAMQCNAMQCNELLLDALRHVLRFLGNSELERNQCTYDGSWNMLNTCIDIEQKLVPLAIK